MRAAIAHIDLDALRHNLDRVQQSAPGRKIYAAVKADGYGHGAVSVAWALGGADGFAVACSEEALILREAGIHHPILLLEGPFEGSELDLCVMHQLQPAIHHPEQLRMLECARLARPIPVWLKLDTGMHRLGIAPGETAAFWHRLRDCPNVESIALMSHLAGADEPTSDATPRQLAAFRDATADLPGPRSLANSAGILAWPETHFDAVRPGLMLYGATPMEGRVAADDGLRPVMTLESRLISVKALSRGGAVGYGGTWTAPEDMRMGIVAMGYGDGYPRHAPSGTPVLIDGTAAPLIGRVSMDMLAVDLRNHPRARVGDRVVLWGEGLPAERIARAAGTIAYELFCGVTGRVYRSLTRADLL